MVAAQCLRSIVKLHRTRIVERLSFRHKNKTVKVAARLKEISKKLRSETSRSKTDTTAFTAQIDRLADLMQKVETKCVTSGLVSLLLTLAETAYNLTKDNNSLAHHLHSAGIPQGAEQARELRVIYAIANYQRVCLRLCECARAYRRVFARLTLTVANATWSEKRPHESDGYKLFVHAEIQLLALHESLSSTVRPRTIIASKRACFLCAAFISSFGTYVLQGSHGEIHRQWTVPDKLDYDEALRNNMNRALKNVSRLVRKPKRLLEPPAPQSVTNLALSTFRQASMETICSRLVSRESRAFSDCSTGSPPRGSRTHQASSTKLAPDNEQISLRARHSNTSARSSGVSEEENEFTQSPWDREKKLADGSLFGSCEQRRTIGDPLARFCRC